MNRCRSLILFLFPIPLDKHILSWKAAGRFILFDLTSLIYSKIIISGNLVTKFSI